MRRQIYRLHDSDGGGMFLTSLEEAEKFNREGFGIFLTVNDFTGSRRISNLRRINAWAVDMDTGTKSEMAAKIRTGLMPTWVIETKRGFHVWWAAADADPHYWNAVVLDRLVPFYGADKNARDIARVLRAPGYYHLKNPLEPFLVEKVFDSGRVYSQEQMRRFYPDHSEPERTAFVRRESQSSGLSGTFWERVWRLDCVDALERISGHDFVRGEAYSFRPNANGKFNILVNGKSTSAFIDQELRIGSTSKGGPSIFQWLRWYGHDARSVIEFIREQFPETVEESGAAVQVQKRDPG